MDDERLAATLLTGFTGLLIGFTFLGWPALALSAFVGGWMSATLLLYHSYTREE